jgi:hypothetical protein
LLVTLILAIVGGLLTGFIVSRECFNAPHLDYMFMDDIHFHGVDYGYKVVQSNYNACITNYDNLNESPRLK